MYFLILAAKHMFMCLKLTHDVKSGIVRAAYKEIFVKSATKAKSQNPFNSRLGNKEHL